MPEECPSFLVVLVYLMQIIVAVLATLYLSWWIYIYRLYPVPIVAWGFYLAFALIAVYAGCNLIRLLFAAE
jgi:hypothetical protein